MPRSRLVAGNWKMNGLRASLAEIAGIETPEAVEVALCPPATLLAAAVAAAAGRLAIGGQDCHAADSGAHTGDIAAPMLADLGARLVILGHSERRADHGEDDAAVAAKLATAQAAGLVAILCVGESAATRADGRAEAVVAAQLLASLPDKVDPALLVVAYEPVWAIGSGRVPETAEIAAMHAALRSALAGRLGADAAEGLRILYGGSVNAGNAGGIAAIPGVDGALVGGASLKAESLNPIIRAFAG